jgi:hypothetical protein
MHGRIRQLLPIGGAALILAAITEQWVAGLPAATSATTAGVRLDEPPPWSNDEPGRVIGVAMGGSAAQAGLRRGDRVLSINGIPIWSYHELHRLVDNSRPGDTLEYTVLRGTQTRAVPLRLEGRLGGIWVKLLCTAFAAGIFFGVGAFVYWKHPKDSRALTFFLMCLPFALIFSEVNFAAVTQGDFVGPSAITSKVIVEVLLFLLFPPLLYLPLIFPKPRPLLEKYPGILGWFYGLPALIAVWIVILTPQLGLEQKIPNLNIAVQPLIKFALGRRLVAVALAIGLLAPAAFLIWRWVRSARRKGWRSALYSQPGLSIAILFFTPVLFELALIPLAAGFVTPRAFRILIGLGIPLLPGLIATLLALMIVPVAACVSLFRNYRGEDSTGKRQLRWPFWGTVTAVAGFLLSFATLVLLGSFGRVFIGDGWIATKPLADQLPTLFLLLIPISFAFAIAKHRLVE